MMRCALQGWKNPQGDKTVCDAAHGDKTVSIGLINRSQSCERGENTSDLRHFNTKKMRQTDNVTTAITTVMRVTASQRLKNLLQHEA
jgi:hypothetical protein